MELIRVLLVDDHAAARQALAFGLEEEADLVLVSESWSGADAIARVQELNGEIDVIVMDVQMATPTDGLDATALLRTRWPQCQVIILSSSEHHAAAARQAGALGYVLKGTGVRDIILAIRAVHRGVLYYEVGG